MGRERERQREIHEEREERESVALIYHLQSLYVYWA